MHRIRLAVRENRLSTEGAVTEASYRAFLDAAFVAEGANGITGFAAIDLASAGVWALFVDPTSEGLGIGGALHDRLIAAAAAKGLERLWLTTASGTRAALFYQRRGWTSSGTTESGELRFERSL